MSRQQHITQLVNSSARKLNSYGAVQQTRQCVTKSSELSKTAWEILRQTRSQIERGYGLLKGRLTQRDKEAGKLLSEEARLRHRSLQEVLREARHYHFLQEQVVRLNVLLESRENLQARLELESIIASVEQTVKQLEDSIDLIKAATEGKS